MSAVLRVYGRSLNLDEVLDGTTFEPCAIQRRGERRFPESTTNQDVFSMNAIFIDVSDADFSNFGQQINDAIEFLDLYDDEIESLMTSQGVEDVYIDFGIAKRDVVAQVDVFPGRLVRVAGKFGIGLGLSRYPISDSE
jgi:hypothetical protein